MSYRAPHGWLKSAYVADQGARLVPAHLMQERAALPVIPSLRQAKEGPSPRGGRQEGEGVTVTLSPALAILVKAIAVHEALDESDLNGVIDFMAATIARDVGLGELARAVADHGAEQRRQRKQFRDGGP